jgi:PPOX class probable F420-dependent enzyme
MTTSETASARATIPDQFRAFLAEPRTAILSVSRGEGRAPHATPVWFNFEAGRFEISITRTRTKFRFIQRFPEASLVIDDPMGYRTVIVEGRCEVIEEDDSLLALAKKLRAKYRRDQRMPPDDQILRGLRAEERVVIRLEPTNVISWAR